MPRATFVGLVGTGDTEVDADSFLTSNGLISIKTRTRGSILTGTLRLGTDRIPFKGKFASDGSATMGPLMRKKSGLPAVTINLRLAVASSVPSKITGAVSEEGGAPWEFVALTPVDSERARYTIALLPQESSDYAGYGFATITITAKGSARMTGNLPEGSRFTATTSVGDGLPDGAPEDKIAPVFVPLYRTKGLLTGELHIDKIEPVQGSSVDDGQQPWGWVKPGSPALLEPLSVKGRSFAVTRGVSLLTGTNAGGFFVILGADDEPIIGSWPVNNKPAFVETNYRLRFRPGSGVVRGLIKTPKTTYEGIMFSAPITLLVGAPPVHGAGYKLDGAAASSKITILAQP